VTGDRGRTTRGYRCEEGGTESARCPELRTQAHAAPSARRRAMRRGAWEQRPRTTSLGCGDGDAPVDLGSRHCEGAAGSVRGPAGCHRERHALFVVLVEKREGAAAGSRSTASPWTSLSPSRRAARPSAATLTGSVHWHHPLRYPRPTAASLRGLVALPLLVPPRPRPRSSRWHLARHRTGLTLRQSLQRASLLIYARSAVSFSVRVGSSRGSTAATDLSTAPRQLAMLARLARSPRRREQEHGQLVPPDPVPPEGCAALAARPKRPLSTTLGARLLARARPESVQPAAALRALPSRPVQRWGPRRRWRCSLAPRSVRLCFARPGLHLSLCYLDLPAQRPRATNCPADPHSCRE